MPGQLGMNVDVVEASLNALRADAELLGQVEQMLQTARYTSMNPLSYAVSPGAAILAPWSIATAAQAQAELASAADALDYLISRLRQDVSEQRDVSSSSDSSYLYGIVTHATIAKPTGSRTAWHVLAGDSLFLYDLATVPFFAVRETGMIFDKAPVWMKDVAKYSTKYLLKLGNLVPYAGLATSAASTALEWEENEKSGNDWGNVRNSIGATLALAEVATLAAPPVSAVIATVGIAWDVFDLVWDIGEDFFW